MTTTYLYGADGLRTRKKVGSTVYDYYYADGLLIRQTWGSNYMDFLYDETGSAYSFIYNGTQYYYVKNLQGDVVKIVNTSGSVVGSYSYDAWGKVTNSGSIGQINPIRYRGYYYDTDTGFYYLQSRYYDPAIKRFISADSYANANGDLLGFNMYAYCGNNPVMHSDPSGQAIITAIIIGTLIGAVIGGTLGGIEASIKEENVLNGVVSGSMCGALAGAVAGAGGAYLIGGMVSIAEDLISDTVVSLGSCQSDCGSITDYCLSFALGGTTNGLNVGGYDKFLLNVGTDILANAMNDEWDSFEKTAYGYLIGNLTSLIKTPFVGTVVTSVVEVFYDYHEVKYEK